MAQNPRRFRAVATATLVLAWAASSVLIACVRRGGRAPLVVPAAGPWMDHPSHLAKDIKCEWCHLDPKHTVPGEAKEPRPPVYAACAWCHDEQDKELPPEKRVRARFFDAEGKPRWTRASATYIPDVKWHHAPHEKVACASCHG